MLNCLNEKAKMASFLGEVKLFLLLDLYLTIYRVNFTSERNKSAADFHCSFLLLKDAY
jgi:hypothetical protein